MVHPHWAEENAETKHSGSNQYDDIFPEKHFEDDVVCRFRVRFSSVLLNLYPSAAAEIVLENNWPNNRLAPLSKVGMPRVTHRLQCISQYRHSTHSWLLRKLFIKAVHENFHDTNFWQNLIKFSYRQPLKLLPVRSECFFWSVIWKVRFFSSKSYKNDSVAGFYLIQKFVIPIQNYSLLRNALIRLACSQINNFPPFTIKVLCEL